MNCKNILNIRIGVIAILLSLSPHIYSQDSANCDLKFINHLVNIGDFEDALYVIDSEDCYSGQSNDSLNYLRAWSLYSLNRLRPSAENFLKVSPVSEYFIKSQFFAAYNYAHIGDLDKANEILEKMDPSDDKLVSLKNFESAGIYLLMGKNKMFDESFARINTNVFEISQSSINLSNISNDMIAHKNKSLVIAGLLSGIVPGSGKFYSGKKGEAITAFIATVGLGFVSWENYRYNGINDFRTIAFGTAFAFSYAANIYGSVLTVKITENEYRENVKNSILFNLHIPLRNTFSK